MIIELIKLIKKVNMKYTFLLIFFLSIQMISNAQHKFASLNHIALDVTNLAKSNAFYKTIIQIDSIAEPFHDGKHKWFKVGEHAQLHLIEVIGETAVHYKGTHLCFSVTSIEDIINKLQQYNIPYENWKGVKSTFTLRPDGVKQIYFQDPDGYWIEINNDQY